MSATLLQFSIFFSPLSLNTLSDDLYKKPINTHFLNPLKIGFFSKKKFKLRVYKEKWSFFDVGRDKGGILVKSERFERGKRVVLVRFNDGFNGGGGGGGGRDNSETVRIVGNIALAVGLTYLSTSGQLNWLFDAIGWVLDILISIWLLAVIIPVVGYGAFLWWAGRDIVQSACPNCGNEFQIFKSTMKDELQLCPYCSQPFSVVGDELVSDSVKFSNSSRPLFGEAFRDFSSGFKKGKESSSAIVDVEAEVKDVD